MKTSMQSFERPGFFVSLLLAAVLLPSGVLTSTLQAAKTVGEWGEIYSGVWYATGSNSSPLQRVYALKIDTENPTVKFKATPGNGGASGETTRQTTPAFRSANGLQVAINANYYQVVGSGANIEGLLISNGNVISGGGSYGYRPAQLLITAANVASTALQTTTPSGVHTGVAGSSFPLLGGVTYGENSEYNPRTGIGVSNGARYIIIVVIDGRQPGYSNGATTLQLGQWLKDFGAWQGLMLDGGGSSTLVSQGAVKNSPSDGSPRVVGANFGAFAAPKGATENASMTTAADGRVWFAQSQNDGYVYTRYFDPSVSPPWGDTIQHAALPGVALRSAPAIVGQANGDVRLFSVTTDGQMHTRVWSASSGSWGSVSDFGPSDWSIETAPVATLLASGEIAVAGVTGEGALKTRIWSPTSGWDSFVEHGQPTWSPRARPALVGGTDGRLHLMAIKNGGALYSRDWSSAGGWNPWTQHHDADWAVQGGVAATARANGDISWVAMKASGSLRGRTGSGTSWGGLGNHGPGWANKAVPGIAYANNRLWIFATKSGGQLQHRSWTSGDGWSSWINNGGDWSANVGPTAVAVPSGGLLWISTKTDANLRSRRLLANGSWNSQNSHGTGWVK